jgi:RHS repeat-associated protein
VINRMTQSTSAQTASGQTVTTNQYYLYLPDGLIHRRVSAITGGSGSGYDDFNSTQNNPTIVYRYDGQMPIEEENFFANAGRNQPFRDDITRNTVGPRGIDMIEAERVNSAIPNDPLLNNPSRVFPVYDGHGNMVASLKRGSGSYTLANEKRYDAWGQVRYDDGVGTSDHVINPRNRFCGNLGHWDDDLLGLTYMRARWYEPTTGRFISEDPAMDGANWFLYCKGNPLGSIDFSGKRSFNILGAMFFLLLTAVDRIWQPDTAQGRCVKEIVESIAGAIDSLIFFAGAMATDPSGRGALGASLMLLLMPLVAGVLIANALNQLRILILINEGDFECPTDGSSPSDSAGTFIGFGGWCGG